MSDGLDPARGIIYALFLSALIWLLIWWML
jgi:hypothetical protein